MHFLEPGVEMWITWASVQGAVRSILIISSQKVVTLCVTSWVGSGSCRITGTLIPDEMYFFFFSNLPHSCPMLFSLQSKVFLLQESCCNIALLSIQVVTYLVACVAMLTHSFVKSSLMLQLSISSLAPRIPWYFCYQYLNLMLGTAPSFLIYLIILHTFLSWLKAPLTILYSLDSMLNPCRILNGWAHLDGTHIVGKRSIRAFERW